MVSKCICHYGIAFMTFKHMPVLTAKVIPLGYNVHA